MEYIFETLYFSLIVTGVISIPLWYSIKKDKERNKFLEDTNEVLTELEKEMLTLKTIEEIKKFNKRLSFASNTYTYDNSLSIRHMKIIAYLTGKVDMLNQQREEKVEETSIEEWIHQIDFKENK